MGSATFRAKMNASSSLFPWKGWCLSSAWHAPCEGLISRTKVGLCWSNLTIKAVCKICHLPGSSTVLVFPSLLILKLVTLPSHFGLFWNFMFSHRLGKLFLPIFWPNLLAPRRRFLKRTIQPKVYGEMMSQWRHSDVLCWDDSGTLTAGTPIEKNQFCRSVLRTVFDVVHFVSASI